MIGRITLAALVAVCLVTAGRSPQAADGKLVVSTQGFADAAIREYIVPRMKSAHGIEVLTTPALSSQALAKAIAQRSDPQIDVFLFDAGPWLQGRSAGLWTDLPVGGIQNLANIPAALKDAQGVAYGHLVIGLLYDSKKLDRPPASLKELFDPKYSGKIAVPSFSSTFAFALLDRMNGPGAADSPRPMDAGFVAMKRLAPSILSFYGSGSQLVDLFKQNEIVVAWGGSYVAQSLGPESGIKWVAPEEGAELSTTYAAIAKGSRRIPAAAQFIDLLLSAEFQALLAKKAAIAFTNEKTVLDPDYARTTPLTPEVIARGSQPPWTIFNANRVQLNERWQRDLESR